MQKAKILDITEKEMKIILDKLYKYFEDPFEFEKFCKIFLIEQKFDEVEVTKRYKDGGIDLKALKRGIDDNGVDTIYYYIQAKRFKPQNSVPIKDVRALKGVLTNSQYKGIFITTSKYTKGTYEFINSFNPKEIILINGLEIIKKCIELQIGFCYKPILNISYLDKLMSRYDDKYIENKNIGEILKNISENDIKTRILPIPTSILKKIPISDKSYKVIFNGKDERMLNINRDRRYFGGITDIYKKYRLEEEDKTINPMKSYWNIDESKSIINIYFSN